MSSPVKSLPPLASLRVFDAVARHGSFTLAADELAITQAAVSRQIKRLEEDLGTALFERGHRSIGITPAGRKLQRAVRRAFVAIGAATEEITAHRRARRLSISVSPYFSAAWLTPRLPAFQRKHPDLQIELHHAYEPPDYRRADIDLGINWGRGRWPGVVAERVLSGAMAPVLAPALRRARRVRTPADLLRLTLLYEFDLADWRAWFAAAGMTMPESAKAQRIDDSHALRQAALDQQGVALFFTALSQPDIAQGRLERPFATVLDSGNDYYLNYPQLSARKPALRQFRQWLLGAAKDPA
jgi:DNA-binding transcriptional LysR family regulator